MLFLLSKWNSIDLIAKIYFVKDETWIVGEDILTFVRACINNVRFFTKNVNPEKKVLE